MARLFDGTDDWINDAGKHYGPTMSVSAWIYLDNFSVSRIFCGEWANAGNTWIIYFWYQPALRFALNGGSDAYFTFGSDPSGAWHHYLITNNGSTAPVFYFDGVLQTTTGTAQTWSSTANDFQIGKWIPTLHLIGKVAEPAIYSVVLTQAEATSLAKGFSPMMVRPQSLSSYKPLGGRFSPEIDLKSGNGGTVNGATYFEHPRIIRPTSAQIRRFGGAAAATSIKDLIQAGMIPFSR